MLSAQVDMSGMMEDEKAGSRKGGDGMESSSEEEDEEDAMDDGEAYGAPSTSQVCAAIMCHCVAGMMTAQSVCLGL